MIGIGALLVGYIIMKFLHESALSKLDEGEKAKLIDGFKAFRLYGLIGIALLMAGLYVSVDKLLPAENEWSQWLKSGIPCIALGLYFFLADARMRALGLSSEYVARWRLGLVMFLLGLAAVCLLPLAPLLLHP